MSRAVINRKISLYQIISIAMVAALALVILLFLAQGSGSRKPISEVSPKAEALFANDKSQKSSERLLRRTPLPDHEPTELTAATMSRT